jgi:hypothetical protein
MHLVNFVIADLVGFAMKNLASLNKWTRLKQNNNFSAKKNQSDTFSSILQGNIVVWQIGEVPI